MWWLSLMGRLRNSPDWIQYKNIQGYAKDIWYVCQISNICQGYLIWLSCYDMLRIFDRFCVDHK